MSKTYTTVQGDAWDMIAFKQMGSEKLMHTLITVNPLHRNTVFFSAGVDLIIPDVPKQTTNDPVPPWQK